MGWLITGIVAVIAMAISWVFRFMPSHVTQLTQYLSITASYIILFCVSFVSVWVFFARDSSINPWSATDLKEWFKLRVQKTGWWFLYLINAALVLGFLAFIVLLIIWSVSLVRYTNLNHLFEIYKPYVKIDQLVHGLYNFQI